MRRPFSLYRHFICIMVVMAEIKLKYTRCINIISILCIYLISWQDTHWLLKVFRLLQDIFHIIPLWALGHDISPRADRLKGWYMNECWLRVWYEKWHVMICLSYTSTEEIITDLYQNAYSFLARIKYLQKYSYRIRNL